MNALGSKKALKLLGICLLCLGLFYSLARLMEYLTHK